MQKVFLATLAGTAIAVAAPALAQHGGGRGSAPTGSPTMTTGQGSGGMSSMGSTVRDQSRSGSMGSTNASPTATTRANQNSAIGMTPPTDTTSTMTTGTRTRDTARSKSQGPANASTTGIIHANENSVLATGSVPGTALPDIKTGLTVQTTGGTSVGTISKVVTGTDGSIRQVVVTTQDGQTVTLMPNTLTISGGVVTTTSTSVGG